MSKAIRCITQLPVKAMTNHSSIRASRSPAAPAHACAVMDGACCDGAPHFQVLPQLKNQMRVFSICEDHAELDRMPMETLQRLDAFLHYCSPMYADGRRVRVFESGVCRATIRDNFSAAVLFIHLEDIRRTSQACGIDITWMGSVKHP